MIGLCIFSQLTILQNHPTIFENWKEKKGRNIGEVSVKIERREGLIPDGSKILLEYYKQFSKSATANG